MHNKDKLRQISVKPFKDRKDARLNFKQFGEALRDIFLELGVSLPSDKQLYALFEKHGHSGAGVGVEDFEALLFRLLCFMRAHEDVDVTPRESTPVQQRDRQWRQECISNNKRQFADVYEVQGKLGQGNFGTVFSVAYKHSDGTDKPKKGKGKKAKDSSNKDLTVQIEQSKRHTRVCKVISKELAQKSGMPLQKVREELAVLKHLDHPHTSRMFESFEDESSFFLIMETAQGGDLQAYMRDMPPTDAASYERWVAKVLYQTLSAISYCHQRGVVHKDLKLENVMLATPKDTPLDAMHVVVVDFGLSEVFSTPYARSKVVSGTPPYMAPEVWTGNSSKACDLWSCGVMLFLMLSGRYPFMCQKAEEFSYATANQDPDWELMGGASQEAHSLCKQLLLKSDVFRPKAHQAMKHQWFDKENVHKKGSRVSLSKAEIDSLVMLPCQSVFDRFLCRLVATQLDAGRQTRINDFFHALDISNTGILSYDALTGGLLQLGISASQAVEIVKALDVAKRGAVSYTEFLAGFLDVSTKTAAEQDEILYLAWQQFSPDAKGQVKANDIQDALAARGMTVADLPSELLLALRKDASGYLTFEWFKCLLLPGHADLTPPAREPPVRQSLTKRPSWLNGFLKLMTPSTPRNNSQ
jgi:calcium-dependent protein kinase